MIRRGLAIALLLFVATSASANIFSARGLCQLAGCTMSGLLTTGASTGVAFPGSTSGTATLLAQAIAGTPTVQLPNASSILPIYGQQVTYTGPTAARSVALFDVAQTAPAIVGTPASLITQAASIGSTALLTSPASGQYMLCYYYEITQAATTSSSIVATLNWTSASGAGGQNLGIAVSSNVLGGFNSGCTSIWVQSGNVTYSTTYASSGATPMQYALRLTMTRLQ
jgi:hypothetical protein